MTASFTTPLCTSADPSHATAKDWVSEPNPNSSIFTGGGSKDPQDISNWAWKDGAGGLPDKDNLLHSFAARYSMAPDATTCPAGTFTSCELLYFGSDRLDNSGDAQQGFWFFQNKIELGTNSVGGGTGFTGLHKNGDLLVISDFSNGGTTSIITVYEWNTACTKAGATLTNGHTCGDQNLETLAGSNSAKCAALNATPPVNGDEFCGLVNSTTITMPWPYQDKSGTSGNQALNGEFYEGGLNLSSLGLADKCFASVAAETRSSTSTTATLKDFTLGTLGKCETTVTTAPKAGDGTAIPTGGLSIGTGTVTASDQADLAVSGVSSWSGTLKFFLCGPIATTGTCDGTTNKGLQIGSDMSVNQSTGTSDGSGGHYILSDKALLTQAANNTTGAPGQYCWRADFTPSTASADAGVKSASDSSSTECFYVKPVQPTVTTTAVTCDTTHTAITAAVTFGTSICDKGTLSGTATQPGTDGPSTEFPSIYQGTATPTLTAAGGKITFTLMGPDTVGPPLVCSTTAAAKTAGTNPEDVTVSGNGDYFTTGVTPSKPGQYHWVASYSGNSPNTLSAAHNADCSNAAESVTILQIPTQISTTQKVYPQDSATITSSVTGDLIPSGGTVTFYLYAGDTSANNLSNCQAGGTTVNSGGLVYSVPFSTDTTAKASETFGTNQTTVAVSDGQTVYWRVTYATGDQAHTGRQSNCTESTTATFVNDTGPGTLYPTP